MGIEGLEIQGFDNYFQLLGRMARAASQFEGRGKEESKILQVGIAIEGWITKKFPQEKGSALQRETSIREKIALLIGSSPASISDILDAASNHFRVILQTDADSQALIKRLKLPHQEIESVILPPGKELRKGESNQHQEINKPVIPRFQYLIAELQAHGIHADDLIITTGILNPNQLRTQTYILVEVPSIQREVLVCNQRGEATFVSMIHRGMDAYASHTKEELQEMPGIFKLYCSNLEIWKSQVVSLLLSEGYVQIPTDADYLLTVRQEISRITNPEEWIGMNTKTKRELRILGSKLNLVAKKCGIEGSVSDSHLAHLRFGALIFGRDNPHIAVQLDTTEAEFRLRESLGDDPEKWKDLVRSTKTSAEWVKMDTPQRQSFFLAGLGFRALSLKMGQDLNPRKEEEDHLKLGLFIYGETDENIAPAMEIFTKNKNARAELGNDCKKWATALQLKLSAMQWLCMPYDVRPKFEFNGLGLIALARIFGLSGDPGHNNELYLELGHLIFADPILLKAKEECKKRREKRKLIEKEPAKLIEAIKSKMTAHEWISMNQTERANIRVLDMGLGRIGSALGIKNVWSSRENFLKLGIIIFGEDPELQAALVDPSANTSANYNPEGGVSAFITRIQSACTVERWTTWHDKKDHELRFEGFGLSRLAKILKVEGDPFLSKLVRLKMAEKIYGAGNQIVQQALVDEKQRLGLQPQSK